MDTICLQCFISGHVQGVFYRREAYAKARRLGLTGYVKNLPDGRVEVLCCGEKKAMEEMQNWLWRGPVGCQVDAVAMEEVPFQDHKQFEIK